MGCGRGCSSVETGCFGLGVPGRSRPSPRRWGHGHGTAEGTGPDWDPASLHCGPMTSLLWLLACRWLGAAGLGGAGAGPRRDGERRMAGARRRRHLPHRLPLLQPLPRRPGLRPRRPPRHSGRAARTTAATSCRPTRWVLFGHHFAAIAGAGPLSGRCSRPSSATSPAPSGSWSAWCWRARCRTS